MKIDFDHWQGAQLADEYRTQIRRQSELEIISALKPTFMLDGNMYCFTYGELPNDCIQGFGETPVSAMEDFVNNFYNQKAVKSVAKTVFDLMDENIKKLNDINLTPTTNEQKD